MVDSALFGAWNLPVTLTLSLSTKRKKGPMCAIVLPHPRNNVAARGCALPPRFLPDSSHESEKRRAQSGLPDNPIIPTGGFISAAQ